MITDVIVQSWRGESDVVAGRILNEAPVGADITDGYEQYPGDRRSSEGQP